MSVRARILSIVALAAVGVAAVSSVAGASVQPPPGATVGDSLQCRDGSPTWVVSMANSGPNPTIDYTLQSDGGTKVDYDVVVGPMIQRLMPAKSTNTHLTVLADGVTMVDTTQSIEDCGDAVTTTTTVPKVTTPTTFHVEGHPATASTTVAPAAVSDPATVPAKALPFTGSSSLPLGLIGSAFVAAGSVVVLRNRRRL